MFDQRLGATLRAVRVRRSLRQIDVATRADVSRSTVSRLERGHVGELSLDTIRAVCAALDVRLDLVPRWRGGELDRLLNARHSAMHEGLASWLAGFAPDWALVAEVSFSIYGERGVIDAIAWHPASRSLIVIELKTEIVDVQELLGTLDRKRRLAPGIVVDRGWRPARVGVWLLVAEGVTNRRHVGRHQLTLRSVLPGDGRTMRAWLRAPTGPIAALSFLSYARPGNVRPSSGAIRRVRRASGSRVRA